MSGGRGSGGDAADPPLLDDELLAEIEILTELIIAAATATPGRLPQQRIDEILEGHTTPRIIPLQAVPEEDES